MTDFESAVRTAVAAWPAAGLQPDWEDVLRRAGVHGFPARAIGVRHAALAAALAIIAVVLTVPAFGIGNRLERLVTGSKRPGLRLDATLLRSNGSRAGSFSMRTSRLFVTVAGPRRRVVPHVFSHRRLGFAKGIQVSWRLDLAGSDQATDVRIVRNGVRTGERPVALVCRPCSGRTSGTLRLTRSAFSLIVTGRTSVSVSTRQGPARGRIRFEVPQRR